MPPKQKSIRCASGPFKDHPIIRQIVGRVHASDPATDDEHVYWPFTGEYWRDELGYYLYTIKSECGR